MLLTIYLDSAPLDYYTAAANKVAASSKESKCQGAELQFEQPHMYTQLDAISSHKPYGYLTWTHTVLPRV